MIRASALILLILAVTAPGVAAAQTGAQSIDDLIRRANPQVPLNVGAATVRPDGAPTAEDQLYDRRVLDAYRAAQNRQGVLDGRWQVQALDGRVLYLLSFSDPNAGPERIDGAWANPHRTGAAASGYVDSVAREGEAVVIAFSESGASTQLRLSANGAGAYRGESRAGGAETPVVMIRAQNVETRAMGQ